MAEWIPPKLDWAMPDYYGFEDLNRVENNTIVVADLVSQFVVLRPIIMITNRDMKSIEFADSLNRIEGNQAVLKSRYTPADWIANKTNWKANDPFDYRDAARLDKNLDLLYSYYNGNLSARPYCGMAVCGGSAI